MARGVVTRLLALGRAKLTVKQWATSGASNEANGISAMAKKKGQSYWDQPEVSQTRVLPDTVMRRVQSEYRRRQRKDMTPAHIQAMVMAAAKSKRQRRGERNLRNAN